MERWIETLEQLEHHAEAQDSTALTAVYVPLDVLASFYDHLYQMAQGYVKDPVQRKEQLRIVRGWQRDAERLGPLQGTRQR